MGVGEKIAAVAEQTAGGDEEFQPDPAALGPHLQKFALAPPHFFHDAAEVCLGHVQNQLFIGFLALAVHHFIENFRRADLEFIALSAHVLDQDGEVELATAQHAEGIRRFAGLDAQRHVAQQFAFQPVLNMP